MERKHVKAIQKLVKALPTPKSRAKQHRLGHPNLYCEVRPNGSKVAVFRYTSPETGKRPGFVMENEVVGSDVTPLIEEYEAYCKEVKAGIDPLQRKHREQEAAKRQRLTEAESDKLNFRALADWYLLFMDAAGVKMPQLIKKLGEGKPNGYVPSYEILRAEIDRRIAAGEHIGKRSTGDVRKAFIKDVFPAIGDKRANRVTIGDCSSVASRISARGSDVQSNRVTAYMVACFNFGIAVEGMRAWASLVPDFRLDMRNPAANVERVDESVNRHARERTLTAEEVQRLWQEVGKTSYSVEPQLAVALKLLLATGQRVEEVLHAEWSEINWEERQWEIPAERRKAKGKTKHTEPHVIPLEDLHIELLRKAEAICGSMKQAQAYKKRVSYVFPSMKNMDAHRNSNALNQAVRRYCLPQGVSQRKPFELFTPRDCRRTWKTLAAVMDAGDDEIRDRIQGHNLSDLSSSHYQRYDKMVEKRNAMAVYTRGLQCIIDGESADNVVEFRKRINE